MKHLLLIILFLFSVHTMTACTFGRVNIEKLSAEQEQYYSSLHKLLVEKRTELALALDEQIKVDKVRGLNLLEWKHDLAKAEVLLSAHGGVQGAKRLLYQKMADINLGWINESDEHTVIAEAGKAAVLKAYDSVAKGIEDVKNNNEIILKYLSTKDKDFLLRNLDVATLSKVIVAIKESRDELRQVKARSVEQRQQDIERLQSEIERGRNILINVFAK